MVQLAAFCGPSGMSDMKKVMMNDHVEDRKPACGALFASSAPSSPLSPSSSEPSSSAPSCDKGEANDENASKLTTAIE